MDEETPIVRGAAGKEVGNQHLPIKDPQFVGRTMTTVSMAQCAEMGSGLPCGAGLPALLSEIQDKLSEQARYQQLLEQADSCSPSLERSWQNQPLIDTPQLRVGLLTVFRFSSIPLHDHPGACGLQKVLSGRIRVTHYDQESGLENSERVVWLNRKAVREYAVGELAFYYRHSENLHEVTSVSTKSILLNMVVRPYDEKKRSWYFPVTGFLPRERDLYFRLSKSSRATVNRPTAT